MERCENVFQNSTSTPEKISRRINLFIEEQVKQKVTIQVNLPKVNRINRHWNPPPVNMMTMNCDGSFCDISKMGGIGLIIRNRAGHSQATRIFHMRNICNAKQAEGLRLWEDVKWATELKLDNVLFELDCKVIVDVVNKEVSYIDWRLSNLIKDIKLYFSSNSSWNCSYVPKECNRAADALSRLARTDNLSEVWFKNAPPVITSILQEDARYVRLP
ncbi:uncharacterized protein LOC113360498 [Papaver somniferum]|uniref:uncharacterized protein LOC113360498 n=1 Tax=Papaver somniferum TaxID=3469 RepID=UPI000E6F9CAD|nr:uncharacterized protein LOC113360498 [Papaver somniferum]